MALRVHSQVLLVDDEPTFRRILGRYLAHDGFDIMTANNGREALALALERRFDVVVTDVEMPHMDGLELVQRLATAFPEMPVVLMSGSTRLTSREDAIARGAFDFVRKPLALEQLRSVVRRAVLGRRTSYHHDARGREPAVDFVQGKSA